MSIMVCNQCGTVYGPTVFVCPKCKSTDVSRAEVTNPKENTDLREQIRYELLVLADKAKYDEDRPCKPDELPIVEVALNAIEKLVHQTRENAVEEYRQKLNKYKPDSLKEQESYGAFGTISAKEKEYLLAKIKELESKEEA